MKITDIIDLPYTITDENYENLFNIYINNDDFLYFNILKKVDFPSDLDPSVFTTYRVQPNDSYYSISYQYYKTINLWWLICSANQIANSVDDPPIGTILKIINPDYVNTIISEIKK